MRRRWGGLGLHKLSSAHTAGIQGHSSTGRTGWAAVSPLDRGAASSRGSQTLIVAGHAEDWGPGAWGRAGVCMSAKLPGDTLMFPRLHFECLKQRPAEFRLGQH